MFAAGRVLQLDNFRAGGLRLAGFSKMNLWRQDKGQAACAAAFVDAVEGGGSPIPLTELLEVARVTMEMRVAGSAARPVCIEHHANHQSVPSLGSSIWN